MKISNFRNYMKKDGDRFAEIDVETGFFIFKKKQARLIYRPHGEYWLFVYNGEYTPGHTCENLERAYLAQEGLRDRLNTDSELNK
jgi:hypothetical protein